MEREFIPGTREIDIGRGVVYRPIKSWHSGTYAGEQAESIPGSNDGSGCCTVIPTPLPGGRVFQRKMCDPPKTVTHRLYWNKRRPDVKVSAFLSYPNGMGFTLMGAYFWEVMLPEADDVERFEQEEEVEAAILNCIGDCEHKACAKSAKRARACWEQRMKVRDTVETLQRQEVK